MKIEQINTAELIPYARNSRTHSAEQVQQVANSINEFGFTNPVLIDAENGIIAGHGRVMAAQSLALETVPCIRLAHLSAAQKRAYVIADNKLALNSGWDMDVLKAEMLELQEIDFELDLIGFDADELGSLLADVDNAKITTIDERVNPDSGRSLIIECSEYNLIDITNDLAVILQKYNVKMKVADRE